MDGPRIALKVNDRDNVATIFANGIHNGSEVELRDKKGFVETLTVHGEIPYGHKIAVRAAGKRLATSSAIRSTPGPQEVSPSSDPQSGQRTGRTMV